MGDSFGEPCIQGVWAPFSFTQTHTLLSLCSFLFCLLLECSSSALVVRVIKNALCPWFSPHRIHIRIQDMCSKLSKDQQQKGWPWPSLLAERETLWLRRSCLCCAVEASGGARGSFLADCCVWLVVAPSHYGPHPCKQAILIHRLPTAAMDAAGKEEC